MFRALLSCAAGSYPTEVSPTPANPLTKPWVRPWTAPRGGRGILGAGSGSRDPTRRDPAASRLPPASLPPRGDGTPQPRVSLPPRGDGTPRPPASLPPRGDGTPRPRVSLPPRGDGTPRPRVSLPPRGTTGPRGLASPSRPGARRDPAASRLPPAQGRRHPGSCINRTLQPRTTRTSSADEFFFRVTRGTACRAGILKWPAAQNQEAQGEGPKPLPKVRQV